MISRFNYKPPKKRDSSKDDEYITYTYVKRIKPLSFNDDGSVDKYVEETYWKEEKNSRDEFVKSFDIGSVSEQVMNHLTKGTPLVTAHTLPPADYTKLEKGAQIKRELAEKGISLEMIYDALKTEFEENQSEFKQEESSSEGDGK